jgi:hypothetical protein
MHLFFASRALEQRCLLSGLGSASWGAHAPVVCRRLAQLAAAESLGVLLELPARLRPLLRGASPTEFVWIVVPPLHISFSAVTAQGTPLEAEPRDLYMIKAALISAIEENHGR